eukprot:INCI17151.3.p1 GENE.INCI17151.3~~INCI17151.3.p1  ORF type:complete len:1153 (+),score=218.33 INCI17151.3:3-3461(+)
MHNAQQQQQQKQQQQQQQQQPQHQQQQQQQQQQQPASGAHNNRQPLQLQSKHQQPSPSRVVRGTRGPASLRCRTSERGNEELEDAAHDDDGDNQVGLSAEPAENSTPPLVQLQQASTTTTSSIDQTTRLGQALSGQRADTQLRLRRNQGISQARQLAKRGQARTAIQAVSRTLDSDLVGRYDERMLLERAKLLMKVGKFEEALPNIEDVILHAPHHVEAWHLKATCLENSPLLLHLATTARQKAKSLAPSTLQRRLLRETLERGRAANTVRVMPIEKGIYGGQKHGNRVEWAFVNRASLSPELRGSWVSGERLRRLSFGRAEAEDRSDDKNAAELASVNNPFYRAVASITARRSQQASQDAQVAGGFLTDAARMEQIAQEKRMQAAAILSKLATMDVKIRVLRQKGRGRTAGHLQVQRDSQRAIAADLNAAADKLDAQARMRRARVNQGITATIINNDIDDDSSESATSKLSTARTPPAAPRVRGSRSPASRRSASGRRLPPLTGPTPEEIEAETLKRAREQAEREREAQRKREAQRRQQLEEFGYMQMSQMKVEGAIISPEEYERRLQALDAITRWGCTAYHSMQADSHESDERTSRDPSESMPPVNRILEASTGSRPGSAVVLPPSPRNEALRRPSTTTINENRVLVPGTGRVSPESHNAQTTGNVGDSGAFANKAISCALCSECPVLHAPLDMRQDEEIIAYLLQQTDIPQAGRLFKYIQGSPACENPTLGTQAIRTYPPAFEFLHPTLRDNFKIAKLAMEADWRLVRFASERLRGEDALMADAIAQDVQALQYASLKFSNQRCILDAVTEDGELLRYCNLRMRSKRDIATAALLSRQSAAQFLPPHLQNDVEIFGEAVKAHGAGVLQHAGSTLRSNKRFLFTAVKHDPMTLMYAEESIASDPTVMLAAVRINGSALQYAGDMLRSNAAVAFAAVQQSPLAMEFVAPSLRQDENFVRQCMQIKGYVTGHILKFAAAPIQDCTDIVQTAVGANGISLQFASGRLRGHEETCLIAMRQNGMALKFAQPDMRDNDKVVLAAVQQNGAALQFASAGMQASRHIVEAAVNKTGRALAFASYRLKRTADVIFAALRQDKTAIDFVDADSIDGDPALIEFFRGGQVMKAVAQHGGLEKQLRVLEDDLAEVGSNRFS